ncbi:hypothetical protein Tchl_1978 [Thauera chlorobenzoica]|uniref:Uncharacterized protein n=1 Tax=Thauera chlorobenzoica TaxID=96773 RepID=A0A1L6FD21_9RHOO|nr:hypothetical protein Tchl_1978 [Thauera chlorobenzoica]
MNFPKGAGLGRDSDPMKRFLDLDVAMATASRPQRREILRMLKLDVKAGKPGAAEALADAQQMAELRRLVAQFRREVLS